MKLDLNICGGFTFNVDTNMDENALYELTRQIESETNAALAKVARNHNLAFIGVDLRT